MSGPAHGPRPSLFVALLVVVLTFSACGQKEHRADGYKTAVVPGIARARVIAILGKPQEAAPFSLPGVAADVLTYPFGEVMLQNGTVVAISINNDPEFRGPFDIKLGMSEDDLHAALTANPRHHKGHQESYNAIEKTNDTRTKDLYDESDHVMIELVASNANDALAPFNIAQVTFANNAGMALIDAFTKARVTGLYPDVHVNNFVSEPWQVGR